jgi:Beta-lactamase enzyme family
MRVRVALLVAVGAIAVPTLSSPASAKAGQPASGYPWQQRIHNAVEFLHTRTGSASFAVTDERDRIRGSRRSVQYSSASLVKAMLLVAYLDQRRVRDRRLHGSERQLLGPMIRASDNDAASAVYRRVGPGGLVRVARRAGMRRFVPNPVWGGCQVTARDQARFFFRVRSLIPQRHREYAMGLLRRIVSYERWGIPRGGPPGWRVYFKGGWFKDNDGWRVHQAARLEQGGRHIGIAVLTRGSPTLEYGAATITGVTSRLLRGYR